MADIILDANVMRLYDKPKDEEFLDLFNWLKECGTLVVSQKLMSEYGRHGNPLVMLLIDSLLRDERLQKITNEEIKKFSLDKHYNYTCNKDDEVHARVVFMSHRKKFVGFDKKLRNDINKFRKVDGVKPSATRRPIVSFYS